MGRHEARTRCSFLRDSGSRDCSAGSARGDDEMEVHVVPSRGVEAPSEQYGSAGVRPAGLPSPWAGFLADIPKGHSAGEDSSHSRPSAKSTDSVDGEHGLLLGATYCGCMLCWAAVAEAFYACFI